MNHDDHHGADDLIDPNFFQAMILLSATLARCPGTCYHAKILLNEPPLNSMVPYIRYLV